VKIKIGKSGKVQLLNYCSPHSHTWLLPRLRGWERASLDLRKIGQETGRARRTGQPPAVSTYYVGKTTFTGSLSLACPSSAENHPLYPNVNALKSDSNLSSARSSGIHVFRYNKYSHLELLAICIMMRNSLELIKEDDNSSSCFYVTFIFNTNCLIVIFGFKGFFWGCYEMKLWNQS